MAGRGMGAATKGGGAVGSGPRNKMLDAKSKTTGPIMMKTGGAVNQHKKMAMGEKVAKKMVKEGQSSLKKLPNKVKK